MMMRQTFLLLSAVALLIGWHAAVADYRVRYDYRGKECVGPCILYNNHYHYCYVGKKDWGYCSPNERTPYGFTCKSECWSHSDYRWCRTKEGPWDYCIKNSILEHGTIQTDYKGYFCRTLCEKRQDQGIYTCKTEQDDSSPCSPRVGSTVADRKCKSECKPEVVSSYYFGCKTAKGIDMCSVVVGLEDGMVNFTDENKNNYTGGFKSGKKQGNGTMRYAAGDVYDGHWDLDLQNGTGEYTFAAAQPDECYRFEGQWLNGKRKYGRCYYPNGEVYAGPWRSNRRHGEGKIIYDNKSPFNRFEGLFANDKRTGKGRLTFKDGSFYQGDFKNDLFEGEGHLFFPLDVQVTDVSTFSGQFVRGASCGNGTISLKNGNEWNANFKGAGCTKSFDISTAFHFNADDHKFTATCGRGGICMEEKTKGGVPCCRGQFPWMVVLLFFPYFLALSVLPLSCIRYIDHGT